MKLEIAALFLIFFSVITIILGIIKIHTYPGKIAEQENHPQKDALKLLPAGPVDFSFLDGGFDLGIFRCGDRHSL